MENHHPQQKRTKLSDLREFRQVNSRGSARHALERIVYERTAGKFARDDPFSAAEHFLAPADSR